MGCKGSKHALHGATGLPARAPEPQSRSGRWAPPRHSVALRSSTLGTLSLDRAAAAVAAAGLSFDAAGRGAGGGDESGTMTKAGGSDGVDGGAGTKLLGPSLGGWRPKRVEAPRTPSKTPGRDPEEINVWELMEGLDDDDDEATDDNDCVRGVDRKAQSAPGSPAPPVLDPDLQDAFRKALDDLTATPAGSPSPVPGSAAKRNGGGVETRGIPTFPGIVRARVDVFQEKINARSRTRTKLARKASPPAPAPDSAGRVVVYLTSLRGVRQTYEDCWSTSALLRGYGVRADERDLSMHAGFKDELRAALALGDEGRLPPLPQVFVDGRRLGGAEEVRRLHEAGELGAALGVCDAAPCTAAAKGGAGAQDACAACGGVRFVPCDGCSGSCKVFVEDEDDACASRGGAFRRCPKCNENGLVKCVVC
jgi:glutaredoxin domain-containing cysteine-rich protein 1